MSDAVHDVRIVTDSPEATRELGRRIGAKLDGRAIVLLEGEMGSGKTVMAKGLFEGVGGRGGQQVVSPSYTVVNVYTEAPRPVYHVDLYRLESEKQLLGLEYEDFLYAHGGLTIVEWPRGVPDLLEPDEPLHVSFEPGDDDAHRQVRIHGRGDRYRAVWEELAC